MSRRYSDDDGYGGYRDRRRSQSDSPSPRGRKRYESPDRRRKSSRGRSSSGSRGSSNDSRNNKRRSRNSTPSNRHNGRNSGSSKENKRKGGRSKSRSRRHLHIPQHNSQRAGTEHSATIRVYQNGNEMDKGFDVFISTKNQPSWYRVLDLVSERSPVARPVFHLYSVRGKEVHDIKHLKDGEGYVAIYRLNGPFERCDYGGKKSQQDWEKKHHRYEHKDPTPLDSEETYKIFEFKMEKERSFRR